MTHAVDALEEAMEVLGEAIEDHKEGTLLQAKIEQTVGFADRSAQAAATCRAVGRAIPRCIVSPSCPGKVPEAGWKKLNCKATFKIAYKAYI